MNKKLLFLLEKVLPITPILLFVIIGIIGYTLSIDTSLIGIILSVLFVGLWAVWYVLIRPRYDFLK